MFLSFLLLLSPLDKRQRMALTWPYADPHFAAYMFAAAATAAGYGNSYWNRAASAPYPSPAAPYPNMLMRPGVDGGFSPRPPPPTNSELPHLPPSSSACCNSNLCQGCPSLSSPPSATTTLSPSQSPTRNTMSYSPTNSAKPLFQPYKPDFAK